MTDPSFKQPSKALFPIAVIYFGKMTFDDFWRLTVQTTEGELTLLVPSWVRGDLLNHPEIPREICVDFYDGTLGIPFALPRIR